MQDDYTHATLGMDKNAIIKAFGEPARIVSIKHEEVIIYEQYTSPEHTIANRQYLEFYLDDNGYCHNVKTNYTKPEEHLDKTKTKWTIWGSIAGAAVIFGSTIPMMLYIYDIN